MSPLSLWLTDRSRYAIGTGRCARERYLKNHAGPTGYGWTHKSESLPLMTGRYVHEAIETLYTHLKETDTFPTVAIIRSAIATAIGAYERKVEQRGFRGLLQSESTDLVVKEQTYLLIGLVWTFCHTVLPWIHRTYRITENETESIYVLDCTCGLGSAVLDAEAHDAKQCLGIGQMLRQDCIAEHRESGNLAYFEAKTTGWGGDNWAPQWETKPQLGIGSFGVVERYGKEITENFIVGLYKGSRKTVKAKDPFESDQVRQESPFCYGFLKAGNPPLATDDWKPSYEWMDESGATRRVGRDYQKTGVWTIEEGDWPVWVASKHADPTLTPAECWVNFLPPSVLEKQVFLVGPLNRQDSQIASLKRQIVGEERRWQEILWKLYEKQSEGHGWASDAFQALLDHLVPASFECRRFGLRHECEFKKLCFKESGWEDPSLAGYIPRRPHHTPELLAAIERGLLPEHSEEDEDDEDA